MSGPAIALVAIGGTLYTMIGVCVAYGMACMVMLGTMFDNLKWYQVLGCLALIPLWAPALILYFITRILLLPIGG